MNMTYLKYAVEVAKYGGLNKAAENLMIAPSNLSHAIKELETSLNIRIFERTSKGMALTLEGKEFIERSDDVLRQINEIELLYKRSAGTGSRFAVSVPRAAYISEAFHNMTLLGDEKISELYYRETNSKYTLESVVDCTSNIGIVNLSRKYDKYMYDYIAEKGLSSRVIAEYENVVVANRNSRLADLDIVTCDDLNGMIEISFADPFIPYISTDTLMKTEITETITKRIYVIECMSSFSIINKNPQAFICTAPMPSRALDCFGLVQKQFRERSSVYKDILVWRNGYTFSYMDRKFIDEVRKSALECGISAEKQ